VSREITHTTFFIFSDFFRFCHTAAIRGLLLRHLPHKSQGDDQSDKTCDHESDTHTHLHARAHGVKPKRKNVLLSTIILLPHFSIVSARTVERFVVFVFLVVFVFDDERSIASLHLDLFGGTERFPASPTDARRTFGPRSHFYQFVRQARSVH
jgi:hypothetical protein